MKKNTTSSIRCNFSLKRKRWKVVFVFLEKGGDLTKKRKFILHLAEFSFLFKWKIILYKNKKKNKGKKLKGFINIRAFIESSTARIPVPV